MKSAAGSATTVGTSWAAHAEGRLSTYRASRSHSLSGSRPALGAWLAGTRQTVGVVERGVTDALPSGLRSARSSSKPHHVRAKVTPFRSSTNTPTYTHSERLEGRVFSDVGIPLQLQDQRRTLVDCGARGAGGDAHGAGVAGRQQPTRPRRAPATIAARASAARASERSRGQRHSHADPGR